MDARHVHAALAVRPIKSDRNDARALAEMVRVGWFKEVPVKGFAAHERIALLGVRRRLVDIRVEIDGQIRGILKTFGLEAGRGRRASPRGPLGFDAVLHRHLLAFADHGAEFYAGSGNDQRRALDLARINVANRPTLRALQ
jgi:transposase